MRILLPLIILASAFAAAALPAESIFKPSTDINQTRYTTNSTTPPDILLITADGVNAEYTSLDDSGQDTTPFLREMSAESLKALNAFSNAQGTIGSLSSMLTGRYPVDIRVIYSNDKLQDKDAFRHLPGILQDFGYYTAQFSNAVYGDAYKTNLQGAFMEANGRSAEEDPLIFTLGKFYPGIVHLFQEEVIERLTQRLGHIYFINDMTNPFEQVTESPVKFEDQEKLERVFTLLEETRQPLFIHLHWMGTHGPRYFPAEQVFSAGIDVANQGMYEQPLYFDALLEFDLAVEKIVTYLAQENRLDNTIIIVTSDHSQRWTNSRIPLLIRFPNGNYNGIFEENVQSLDLAPTLLNYLGIEKPDWMAGQSLISTSYEQSPIFTAKIPRSQKNPVTGKVTFPESKPPFYQFGRISVVVCDQWFELDLQQMTITEGKVKKYQSTCGEPIGKLEALDLLTAHLERYGFDTSSLEVLKSDLSQ